MPTLQVAFKEAIDIAVRIKQLATEIRDLSAAGPIPRRTVWGLANDLNDQHARLGVLASVPGIGAYAQAQYDNDTGYNVGAEFTAMRSAIANTRDWIIANAPKNGSNPIIQEISGTAIVPLEFTTAQANGLRTQLDALIATID